MPAFTVRRDAKVYQACQQGCRGVIQHAVCPLFHGIGSPCCICIWSQSWRLEGCSAFLFVFRCDSVWIGIMQHALFEINSRANFARCSTSPSPQEAIWRGNVRIVGRGKELTIRGLAQKQIQDRFSSVSECKALKHQRGSDNDLTHAVRSQQQNQNHCQKIGTNLRPGLLDSGSGNLFAQCAAWMNRIMSAVLVFSWCRSFRMVRTNGMLSEYWTPADTGS